MKTLKQAAIGDTVKVVKLHGEGAVKRRIMDMGITRGAEVHIRKVAPPVSYTHQMCIRDRYCSCKAAVQHNLL